jgi:hypothetical protein
MLSGNGAIELAIEELFVKFLGTPLVVGLVDRPVVARVPVPSPTGQFIGMLPVGVKV